MLGSGDPAAGAASTSGLDLVHRARSWLGPAFGIAGLLGALATALGPLLIERGGGGAQGVATVDGRAIPRATYERAIAALEADKRNPVTPSDRRLALSRLIDEELLVRRGLDLGLADVEPTVRKALVDAMLQLASVPEVMSDPGERELRAFYAGRPTLFAGEPLVTIALVGHAVADKAKSERMSALLRAGAPFERAVAETGAEALPQPPALASLRKLADYVGPTVAEAVRPLAAGDVVGPLDVSGRSIFVLVQERREGERPPFEAVRAQVLEAWRRAARDRALESYLAGLRGKAQITFAPDAPK